jgi:hypothetical protein
METNSNEINLESKSNEINLETKLKEIINKLNIVLDHPELKSPYTLNLENLTPDIINNIQTNQDFVKEFVNTINELVAKVNNPEIYTNAKSQDLIDKTDMDKLKIFYEKLLNELNNYIKKKINESPTDTVDTFNLENSLDQNTNNYYEIIPITNIYKKYYLGYLISNIITLKQYFKIFSEIVKLTEINVKNIKSIIDNLNSESNLIIYLNDNSRDCVSFSITKLDDQTNLLTNNTFNIKMTTINTFDNKSPVENQCQRFFAIKYDENLQFNFTVINIKFTIDDDDKELTDNFIFNINYYKCKSKDIYLLQFVLNNKESKLKFLNNYKELDTFI